MLPCCVARTHGEGVFVSQKPAARKVCAQAEPPEEGLPAEEAPPVNRALDEQRHISLDQPRLDQTGPSLDQTRLDQTRLAYPRPDQTRLDQTRLDQTRPDQTRLDQTGLDWTRLDQTYPPQPPPCMGTLTFYRMIAYSIPTYGLTFHRVSEHDAATVLYDS